MQKRSDMLQRHDGKLTETPESGGYASPACYAHEFAQSDPADSRVMAPDDVVAMLNLLLEAERAGARVLAGFLADYEGETPPWKQLVAVQRDEARNCAILIDLIQRLNGAPSERTGDFLEKALAVTGRVRRLRFLNRGQRWVARKIHESLPHVEQDFVRGALFAMEESHLLNIEACDALAEALEAENQS
jgi:nitronate monooxygenase